jgi:hypothetical protein
MNSQNRTLCNNTVITATAALHAVVLSSSNTIPGYHGKNFGEVGVLDGGAQVLDGGAVPPRAPPLGYGPA